MFKKIRYLIIISLIVSNPNMFSSGIRPYLKTGNWYPRNPGKLKKLVDTLLEQSEIKVKNGRVEGIVVPHAGIKYSGKCAAAAYRQIISSDTEKIFILGVSHRGEFSGALLTDYNYYSTPLGKIRVDMSIVNKLKRRKGFFIDNKRSSDEHSIENQLPFIQRVFKKGKFKIVPILFGYLDISDFKMMADDITGFLDSKSIVIASSDMTHYGRAYGYFPFQRNIPARIKALDKGMIDLIISLKFKQFYNYRNRTGITMCGFAPVGILMNIMRTKKVSGHLCDYYRSSDITGDFSLSVSYASIVFSRNRSKEDPLSQKDRKITVTENMLKKRGVFIWDKSTVKFL